MWHISQGESDDNDYEVKGNTRTYLMRMTKITIATKSIMMIIILIIK